MVVEVDEKITGPITRICAICDSKLVSIDQDRRNGNGKSDWDSRSFHKIGWNVIKTS